MIADSLPLSLSHSLQATVYITNSFGLFSSRVSTTSPASSITPPTAAPFANDYIIKIAGPRQQQQQQQWQQQVQKAKLFLKLGQIRLQQRCRKVAQLSHSGKQGGGATPSARLITLSAANSHYQKKKKEPNRNLTFTPRHLPKLKVPLDLATFYIFCALALPNLRRDK